jgi:hypothetical protein
MLVGCANECTPTTWRWCSGAVVSGGIARPGALETGALEIFGVRADYDRLAAASPVGHKEQAMPSEIDSSIPSSEPVASRRELSLP